MKLSKEQLVKACRNQDLDTSGDKAALADRLAVLETVEPEPPEVAPEPPASPPEVAAEQAEEPPAEP